ncbi:hybrid sensor histidine kinase/response regulator [Plebeiibacterium sediminum]|uniref:histidine kinase n=1 Tax=Plebeiibacterium sediminum TaxID=2992112 RepID=A0AAE3M619_9BACT|nr:response regulator [Plebeiobacterium sediminum]MCW3787479.1 response regulator [Plebeiobacterium sediminum]
MKDKLLHYFSKYFIIITTLLVIPLVVFYNYKMNHSLKAIKSQEEFVVTLQNTSIDNKLDNVIDDLLFLAEHVKNSMNQINDLTEDTEQKHLLEKEFKAFCIGKSRIYDQVRFIDSHGYEIVRINYKKGEAEIVKDSSLQRKGHRYYFKEIKKLKSGEVYFSPLDLNIEQGKIEVPLKPMLRVGTPLINKQNEFIGEVVLNYLGSNIIESIDRYNERSPGNNMMVNQKGYYLRNSVNEGYEWAFMYDSLSANNFIKEYGKLWDLISNSEKGQIKFEENLVTFQTIYPLHIYEGRSLQNNKVNVNYYWKLVSFLSKDKLDALLYPIVLERRVLFFILLMVSATVSLLLTRIRSKENEYKNNLLEINKGLEEKVKEKTKEYLIAKEKAEESDRLKTAFLNNMSHEIRTPLNGIVGFASLLVCNSDDKEKLKQFSNIILSRSQDLLNIINDILDISKIEAGQFVVQNEACVLETELNKLYEFYSEYKRHVNKTGINLIFKLDFDKEDFKEFIYLDIKRLHQVLNNLLVNAFKFTEKGDIILTVKIKEDNHILFSIADTGIGIAKDKQEVIFKRFVQASNDIAIKFGGSGLGLSIVKAILNAMGCTIRVDSMPGIGSVFYFTYPYNVSKEEVFRVTQEGISVKKVDNSYDILIVEDEEINRMYMEEIFRWTNHNITFAEDGNTAITKAKQHKYDIILMDIKLPDIDGLQVTESIRKDDKDVKIIAQTAYATQEDEDNAYSSGCNGFVAKPIDKDRLLEIINNNFNNKIGA